MKLPMTQNTVMKFNTLLFAAMVATIIAPATSFAEGNDEIFKKSCNMLMTIKKWMFTAVYILGAIGLVLIAISAFVGRFKFAHLISLGGGLFVVAMADLLIDFLTEGTGAISCDESA